MNVLWMKLSFKQNRYCPLGAPFVLTNRRHSSGFITRLQWREFAESDLENSHEQTSQKNISEIQEKKMRKTECKHDCLFTRKLHRVPLNPLSCRRLKWRWTPAARSPVRVWSVSVRWRVSLWCGRRREESPAVSQRGDSASLSSVSVRGRDPPTDQVRHNQLGDVSLQELQVDSVGSRAERKDRKCIRTVKWRLHHPMDVLTL